MLPEVFAVIIGVLPPYPDKFIIVMSSMFVDILLTPSKTTFGSIKDCIVAEAEGLIRGIVKLLAHVG